MKDRPDAGDTVVFLGCLSVDPQFNRLLIQLDSEDIRDRMLAVMALSSLPLQGALPLIKKALADDKLSVRTMAVRMLGLQPAPESLDLLIRLLSEDPDYEMRAGAAAALGNLGETRAVPVLVRTYFEDTSWLVQFNILVALGLLRVREAYEVVLQGLNREEVILQQAAISALGDLGDVRAVPHLLRFASSEDWLLRQRLAEALGHLPSAASRSALHYLKRDEHSQVANAATYALQQLC